MNYPSFFLGGTFPEGYSFTIKAPGAFHHARWMARIIYTLQIALFKHQLVEYEFFCNSCDLEHIWSLAAFLSLFYVKHWFTSPSLTDAAVNDLEMWNDFYDITQLSGQQLRSYPHFFQEMAVAALQKLNLHLWYLTERHIVFAFASDKLSISTKVKMWQKLQTHRSSRVPAAVTGRGLVQMPAIQKTTRLPDLVGPDSLELFKIIPSLEPLSRCNPRLWSQMEEYSTFKTLIASLPATNDACERVLGLVTEIEKRTSAPKNENELKNVIKVSHVYRAQVRKQAKQALDSSKKIDTTTKKFLKDLKW